MRNELAVLIQLFWVFFKIGPITFGGGYAMIPLIEREVVDRKKWIESEEVSDMFALAGTAPGAIAINAAAFIGHKISGVRGAVIATIGVLLPTFMIVLLLSAVFIYMKGNPHVEAAFTGIRAAVVALITYAGIKVAKTSIIDKSTLLLFITMVIMLLVFHWHPILVIFTGAAAGIIITEVKQRSHKQNKYKGNS